MRGQILGVENGVGVLLAADDQRLHFPLSEWRSAGQPMTGQWVDFVLEDGQARNIYVLPQHTPSASAPSVAGASSAFILGAVGVGCLVVGLVIPVAPTIAAFILGMLGASQAREQGDNAALTLSRIAWIGALVLIVLGVVMVMAIFGGLGWLLAYLNQLGAFAPHGTQL